MERVGISSHVDKEFTSDIFGERTKFRALCCNMVKQVVNEQKWFSFCTKASKEQVDIMSIKNNQGKSLGNFISDIYEDCSYRTAIYKYLLRDFLCYYEVPITVKEGNSFGYRNTFNKYLITSNINVVAEWMGMNIEDARYQYGYRLNGVDDVTDESDFFPYLKLYETKDGIRKVTRPRSELDLGMHGTRVIPLFALKEGLDILYKKLLEGSYDITFCKDSGQERVINTTFNLGTVRQYYQDEGYIASSVESWYSGSFLENPCMERGYIRVFELGSSIYDSPLRSINYARIVSFEEAEPDLSYINVDIESVVPIFKDYISGSIEVIDSCIEEVLDSLEVFEVGTERKLNGIEITNSRNLIMWADAQLTLLSTVFSRQLALFMLGNPQWFPDYDGSPKDIYSASDYELEDVGLDLG